MEKYKRGKVYKIVSNKSDLVYYGSTICKLAVRLAKHKSEYKRNLSNEKLNKSAYKLLELGDAKIVLVEDFPCERKEQLIARERFYIENNSCVNKIIPGRTGKEYREANKEELREKKKEYRATHKEEAKEYREKNKGKLKEQRKNWGVKNKEKIKDYNERNKERTNEWRENNKEKIKEKQKERYENNKEEINKQRKEFRENNKDKIAKQNKVYYQQNKEKLRERRNRKVTCECGREINISSKSIHKKSKFHQESVSQSE